MSDPRFLQSGFNPQLAHLVEELGEAIAAAGKTQRWGAGSVNPLIPSTEQETNWNWLVREMADVEQAWGRLKATRAAEMSAVPIDSFGYQVMSLGEITDVLSEMEKSIPQLTNAPVWVKRGMLYCPVKDIYLRKKVSGETVVVIGLETG